MKLVDRICANKYQDGTTIVHLDKHDAISNASEGAKQIDVDCIEIETDETVKVYFETDGYAELVAIFDSSETYMACLPALEKLAEKHNFLRVTESID